MRWLFKFDDALAVAEKALIVFLFSVLISLIVFNIITRNIFNVSFQKVLEITPSFVLWLTLCGSTLALKNQRHIKLELLLRYLGVRGRSLARIISCIFGLAVMGVLLVASFEFLQGEVDIFGIRGWTAIIFPLFFAVSFFRYAVRIADTGMRGSGHNSRTTAHTGSPEKDTEPDDIQ
jgi:TRAP-type C4-dicarboxylate transport system permease small subunit